MDNRICRFRIFSLAIVLIFITTSCTIYNSLLAENISESISLDNSDAACSGYTHGRIIREQQRILKSVRQELLESQTMIEEVRETHEELQRLIPQKQAELSKIEGEIEAAVRLLEEIRQNQNVRVFLPYSPIYRDKDEDVRTLELLKDNVQSFEDFIDFSRCSISSFMPIHIQLETSGSAENSWLQSFRSEALNIAQNPENSCLNIQITDGKMPSKILRNSVIFNIGTVLNSTNINAIVVQNSASKIRRNIDFQLPKILESSEDVEPILPYSRKYLINFKKSEITIGMDFKLSEEHDSFQTEDWDFKNSRFCFLFSQTDKFLENFQNSLKSGCVPVILSTSAPLPFEEFIDWRLASYRIPLARLPEAHFILKSIEMSDFLEMKRMGRYFWDRYLRRQKDFVKTFLSAMRYRLQLPTFENFQENLAKPLFNSTSFIAPILGPVNYQPKIEEDWQLGPLEPQFKSITFSQNFTEFQLYSYQTWNVAMSPHRTKEFMINAIEPPAEAEFYEDSKIGFRPIDPGSGVEFNRALGGNRQREQFTVVLLTYERDVELTAALERLHQLPYLNKIIVIWNNVNREPSESWPALHVPVEFIKVSKNSLNNRFIPWNRIETEAILSLDDDIDLMQEEFLLAFRVWRENRDRIVGFPARYHARYGDQMYYNSNHTCQMSIILTGAAFLHKAYLNHYTYDMPAEIRRHVDEMQNCEDIAMNFLVSHLTRKPPIKTTSRWTIKCPTCAEKLSDSDTHFSKRHECIRLFTKIYGYNPLRFSQFRVDSILFKTRLPENHQKCYKYV